VKESVKEYGTAVVQNRYKKHSTSGLWESEETLIKKYFRARSSILDLACGSGRSALSLYQLGYNVTAIDLTPEMIAIAKATAEEKGAEIIYQVGDATNLGLADESFEGVLLPNNGLASIPGHMNRLKVLQEIRRILKPSSYVILSIPLRHHGLPYTFYWLKTWVEFYVLARFGYRIKGVDFGDFFYHRNNDGQIMDQVQFLHFFKHDEIKNLIETSGLKLHDKQFMAKLSKVDVDSMCGSLSEKDNTEKIQIFYICQKI